MQPQILPRLLSAIWQRHCRGWITEGIAPTCCTFQSVHLTQGQCLEARWQGCYCSATESQLHNIHSGMYVLAEAITAASVLQGVPGPLWSLLMNVLAFIKFVSVCVCSSGRALSCMSESPAMHLMYSAKCEARFCLFSRSTLLLSPISLPCHDGAVRTAMQMLILTRLSQQEQSADWTIGLSREWTLASTTHCPSGRPFRNLRTACAPSAPCPGQQLPHHPSCRICGMLRSAHALESSTRAAL